MPFLPAQWRDGGLMVGQRRVNGVSEAMAAKLAEAGPVKLSVRPEYLCPAPSRPGSSG